MKRFGLILFLLAAALPGFAQAFDQTALESIPIQTAGRIKPLDTFARESVRFITGRETWGKRRALETLVDWMAYPEKHDDEKMIVIGEPSLRTLLGVPQGDRYVSMSWLLKHEGFMPYAEDAYKKQQEKKDLNDAQKEALQVVDRVQLYRDIKSGAALVMVAIPHGDNGGWISLGDLQMFPSKEPKAGETPSMPRQVMSELSDMLQSYMQGNLPGYAGATRRLKDLLAQIGGKNYPDQKKIDLEVHYNHLQPFQNTWILFLLAALLIGTSTVSGARWAYLGGWAFYLGGLGLAIYGFVLRSLISGRPPVTNMYESLIWVIFGAAVFALIFEGVYKNRTFALAGAITAVIGFIVADATTGVLDPGIHPLEPVLRSNYWLTIHVLTITLGYAAFLLSWMLAHGAMWIFATDRRNIDRVKKSTLWTYRAVQVGVVLLAAGTILGGVWANYSWGRFWGWDPKETWALIALLGYIAVLHGRLSGWLRDFGFIVGVVTAFLGVLMAWYGVNFVLGAGLHSYGFSVGGTKYMITFVVLDALVLGYVALRVKGAPKA
jgi:ABC-type transport system involved in cytochrome c biogenesis permease subunit